MKYHQLFAVLTIIGLFSAHCARPCPKDIELGSLSLSATTKSFLPAAQDVNTMTFKDSSGQTLVFYLTNNANTNSEIPVETLCQRGDFLDQTSQVSKYVVQTRRWSFASPGNAYTLDVQAEMQNLGTYGNPADTIFIESFVTWGQKIPNPSRTGTMSVLSSERGSAAKITDTQRQNYNKYRVVADTVLLGKNMSNVYITPKEGSNTLYIFYTKTNGIEAFTTDTETWVRQ